MKEKVVTTRYMQRFTCIGSDCEDNCCTSSWNIFVDKPHYKKIKKVMSATVEGREQFTRNIRINRDQGASRKTYALIASNENSGCGFMTEAGLCGLHSDYGPEILPDVCNAYPRYRMHSGKRIEVYGTLSCPEVARLCLLQADSMHLLESDREFGSLLVAANTADPGTDPYSSYLDAARTLEVELLSSPGLSFRQRQFLSLFFALRTEPGFNREVSADAGPWLQQQVAFIKSAQAQSEILALVSKIESSFAEPLQIIIQTLVSGKRSEFMLEILEQATGIRFDPEAKGQITIDSDSVYQSYKKRSDAIEAAFGARVDQYLTNYAINYWLSYWFTRSRDLVVHTRKLLVRIACLRFLLCSHPNIFTLLESEPTGGSDKILDDTAVEVFYRFSRWFEHNKQSTENVERYIEQSDYGLPLLASLIKF